MGLGGGGRGGQDHHHHHQRQSACICGERLRGMSTVMGQGRKEERTERLVYTTAFGSTLLYSATHPPNQPTTGHFWMQREGKNLTHKAALVGRTATHKAASSRAKVSSQAEEEAEAAAEAEDNDEEDDDGGAPFK